MTRAASPQELEGLHVSVDGVVHLPEMRMPSERSHAFAYFITIHNDSAETVVIHGRKWVIANSAGEVTVVEGEGVVGKRPRLAPGEQFPYNSYHVSDTAECRAEGAYFGITGNGRPVFARIPRFTMRLPANV
ncbi:MAG: ApaG domain [Verrucomicrobiae bacterium]|nr:ApaG domain [Verrucomicrobiae bacterium]